MKNYISCGLLLSVLAGFPLAVIAQSSDAELREQALSLFEPLADDSSRPAASSRTEKMIALGRELFFDKRISSGGLKGCAHCHQPEFYGANGPGLRQDAGDSGSPHNVLTILNASLTFANNWYGDEASVESQAVASLIN